MAIVSFRGGEIAFNETGTGPAVVFLHGFLQSKSVWKKYSKELSKTFRVISIDLPGHGESSNFGYSHSMELMAEAVKAVLSELKVRRYHLIGHSMGGYVSIALGEKDPDGVKGICLFHSSVSSDPPQKQKERDKLIRLVEKSKALFIREAIPNLFNTNHKPYKAAIKSVSKMASDTSVQAIIASLEGMKIRENREMILKFAPYKVLYIIGKFDNVLPSQKLIDEAKLSENAEYILLEKVGHMGFIEEPEECLKAIGKFLRKRA